MSELPTYAAWGVVRRGDARSHLVAAAVEPVENVETVALVGTLAKRSGFVTIAGRTFSLESLNAIVAAHEPGGQVRVMMPAEMARANGLLVQTRG